MDNSKKIEHLTSLIESGDYGNKKEALQALYNERGLAYLDWGEYKKALSDFQEALRLDDKEWGVWYNLGLVYKNLNEPGKAMKNFKKALELNPKSHETHFQIADMLRKKHDYDGAAERYTKAIKLNRKFADAYNNRGLCHKIKGRYKKALEDFERAIKIRPKDPDFYQNRGNLYTAMGEYQSAVGDLSLSLELDQENETCYNNRGIARAWLGDFENAVKDLDTCILLSEARADWYFEGNPSHYTTRGAICAVAGDKARATMDFVVAGKIYKDIEEDFREDGGYLTGRGLNYLYLSEFGNAGEMFDKALALGFEDSHIHVYYACYRWKWEKDAEAALAGLEKAFAGGYRDFRALEGDLFEGYFLKELTDTPEFRALVEKYKK